MLNFVLITVNSFFYVEEDDYITGITSLIGLILIIFFIMWVK